MLCSLLVWAVRRSSVNQLCDKSPANLSNLGVVTDRLSHLSLQVGRLQMGHPSLPLLYLFLQVGEALGGVPCAQLHLAGDALHHCAAVTGVCSCRAAVPRLCRQPGRYGLGCASNALFCNICMFRSLNHNHDHEQTHANTRVALLCPDTQCFNSVILTELKVINGQCKVHGPTVFCWSGCDINVLTKHSL